MYKNKLKTQTYLLPLSHKRKDTTPLKNEIKKT